MRRRRGTGHDPSGCGGKKDPAFVDEWVNLIVALMKVGVGETAIPAAQLARLLELDLVEFQSGEPVLTARGRAAAGIPD
jgi:hypothetical protein